MRHSRIAFASLGVLALALGGCASTQPAEPQVAVMPAKGKSYGRFQRDDDFCQARAQQAIGYRSPGAAANDQAVGGAVVGTAAGAIGAAIGAAAGNAGAGAAIGAGTGLVGGSMVGGANARAAGGSIQGRYDMVYAQCMTARGNRVAAPEAPPVVVVDAPPVYVSPRPYYWGGPEPYYGPGPYYRRGWW